MAMTHVLSDLQLVHSVKRRPQILLFRQQRRATDWYSVALQMLSDAA
jgi:hypothetical protein